MDLSIDNLLSEQDWRILKWRVGLGNQLTLEQSGKRLGISRERVRQLQEKASQRIHWRLKHLAPVLDALERHAVRLGRSSNGALSQRSVVERVQRILVAEGWQKPPGREVQKLLIALRSLSHSRKFVVHDRWPKVLVAACLLDPVILRHPDVAAEYARRQRIETEAKRTWTYEELAETVLQDAGSPLHWTEIVERAEILGRRSNVVPAGLRNALTAKPDKFSRVGQGTYGLVSMGFERSEYYPDIIAKIMHHERNPLSYGAILQKVGAIRRIKETSLNLFLAQHPRFYASNDGRYGLRLWLPPRHKQNLRTPAGYIEEARSFLRVGRARERGYDIEILLEEDRVLQSIHE
ncbi:MAG: HTH domain-containing protein [Chloroflexota bacterium]|nr:HTH domain-containing protein [Chloroflexota bacterium]